ncbi:MAG: hypothetical protein MJ055_05675 [Phascolarctobacterium sp.]|nr:hypothetical protein [Phascolarctobacterium sp.]
MKKFLVALTTGILTMAASTMAWAAPSFYKNPAYNMANLQAIKVMAINNNSVVKNDDYQLCSHAEDTVIGGLYEAGNKAKLMIADMRNSEQPTPANVNAKAPLTVELKITIAQMGIYQDLVPGYWREDEEEEIMEVWNKDKRKWEKQIVKRKVKVWVPERWRDNCEISLNYSIVDPTDGTVIANSIDNRKRSEETDVHGMVKRSTRDFLKNLTKKK